MCSAVFVITLVTFLFTYFSSLSFEIAPSLRFEVAWQTVVFSILPYALIQWASKYSDEITIAMYDGVVEPLTGGLVAWGLFKETASVSNVVGALIMVCAFAFSVLVMSGRHFLVPRTIK